MKDRLLRADFCPSLLTSCETRSEQDNLKEEMQVGVLYYKVIQRPIDLHTIRTQLDGGIYTRLAALERDLLLLLANARKFAAEMRRRDAPGAIHAQESAAALLAGLRRAVRAQVQREKAIRGSNERKVRSLLRRVARDAVSNVKIHERKAASLRASIGAR